MNRLSASKRHAFKALCQHRWPPQRMDDEDALTASIIKFASRYGHYCIRRITALFRRIGSLVNDERIMQTCWREALRVPHKQSKRAWLWFNDGSCIRLRLERPSLEWVYDFVQQRTSDGCRIEILTFVMRTSGSASPWMLPGG